MLNLQKSWKYTDYHMNKPWIDFARGCDYIKADDYNRLIERNMNIGKMLGNMIINQISFAETDRSLITDYRTTRRNTCIY